MVRVGATSACLKGLGYELGAGRVVYLWPGPAGGGGGTPLVLRLVVGRAKAIGLPGHLRCSRGRRSRNGGFIELVPAPLGGGAVLRHQADLRPGKCGSHRGENAETEAVW